MNKSKQKKYPSYDQDVLNVLQKKYGYTKSYIKKFLTGDRKAFLGDQIVKEYHQLVKHSKQAQREKQQKLENIVKD